MKNLKLFLSVLFFSFVNANTTFATHILGGDLTYEHLGNKIYSVTLKLHRDCNGIALANTVSIAVEAAGCGVTITSFQMPLISTTDISNICSSQTTFCTGGTSTIGIEETIYNATVDLSTYSNIVTCYPLEFSWNSCCRIGNITTGPANEGISLIAMVHENISIINHSPVFNNTPIFNTCVNSPIYFGQAVTDEDNDSLVFSLMDCYDNISNTTVGYNNGFSGTQPFSSTTGVTIDAETGVIEFTPTTAEIGIICVKVEEYRNGVLIGEVGRDLQLIIENCSNDNPKVSGINGTATNNGTTGNYQTTYLRADKLFCFNLEIYTSSSSQNLLIEYTDLPGAVYTIDSSGTQPKLNVCWIPTINDLGTHLFSVILTDDNCPVISKSIQTFKFNVAKETIEGRITFLNNAYLSGIVYLMDSTKTKIDSMQNTTGEYQFYIDDTDNFYHVSILPDTASNNNTNITYFDEQSVIQYATPIPITAAKNIANIEILDTIPSFMIGVIEGVVTDANTGLALPNVRVVLVDDNFKFIKSQMSQSDGSIAFHKLFLDESYHIWVDDLAINNDLAPMIHISSSLRRQEGLEFKVHDNYLELVYPTNTTEIEKEYQLTVTPNPSDGIFNFSFNNMNNESLNIEVLNLNGEIVKQMTTVNNNLNLDLSAFPSQIYLVRITTEKGMIIKKLLKQ